MPRRNYLFFPAGMAEEGVVDDKALDLDGAEYLQNTTDNTLGFTTTHSMMLVVKPTTANNLAAYLHLKADADSKSSIRLFSQSGVPDMRVQLRDEATGNLAQDKTWDSVLADDTWVTIVYTFTGPTSLTFYKNGADEGAADATATNNSTTMADRARKVIVAAQNGGGLPLTGRIHSAAIWSTALSSVEVTAIYNGGAVGAFDLQTDSGDYSSAASLKHWWRHGLDDTDIGKDEVVVGGIDIGDNAVGITSADIVTDSPS